MPFVFLGTVTEISEKAGSFKTARMRVDRSFKGELKRSVEFYDDGMCDGPDLEPGRQYLMYTSGSPAKAFPARGCTRSRRVEDADEDLEFWKSYVAGASTTRVFGTVRLLPDRERTLKGVRVSLKQGGRVLQSTTDALGDYSFTGPVPGQYTIDATLAGYDFGTHPVEVELGPKGCVAEDLLLSVDRRVQGTVRDDKGTLCPVFA